MTEHSPRSLITVALVLVSGVIAGTAAAAGPLPPLPPLPLPPVNISPPSISGTTVAGSTVTCSPGQWLNNPTAFTYSWQRNLVTNAAGPSSSDQYTVTTADVGQLVTCTVTAANAAGSTSGVSLPVIPAAGSGGAPGTPGTPGAPGTTNLPGGFGAGAGSPGSGSPGRPTLLSFSVSPRRLVITSHNRRQSTKGLVLHYRLDRAADVVFVIERRLPGRMAGKRCVTAARRSARAKRCNRYLMVTTLTVKGAVPGDARLAYRGRVGNHLLYSGNYSAFAAAVTPAGWSNTRTAGFGVVRRVRR